MLTLSTNSPEILRDGRPTRRGWGSRGPSDRRAAGSTVRLTGPESHEASATMYRFSYNEILEDAPDLCRERERAAFDRALALLRKADAADAKFEDRGEAVSFLQRLWDVLIEDLLNPENGLPEPLRTDLVSIGLWSMREASEALRLPERSLAPLIDVNTAIRDGLR